MRELLKFHAIASPRLFLGPLFRVYVDGTSISGAHIGHQLNDPSSAKASKRAAHYDTIYAQGQSLLPHDSRNFEIKNTEVACVTLDLNRNPKAPLAPGTITISQRSGETVTLMLVQSADTNAVAQSLGPLFANFTVIPKSESADWRPHAALAILFSLATVFFVWYGCQRLENLPVLVAVPPNIYGIVVCVKVALRRHAVGNQVDGE